MNESTRRLVAALREQKQSPQLDAIIARAEREEFHDFSSESPTPMLDLVEALEADHRFALAKRVKRGEFGATREESDAWGNSLDGMETREWAASPEGRAAIRQMFAEHGDIIGAEVLRERYGPTEAEGHYDG